MSKPEQLSLRVALSDDATFDNFYAVDAVNQQQVVAVLKNGFLSAREPFVYLWGAAGCGVTHLLQATCHEALFLGKCVQYLPLDELHGYPPRELLFGLDELDVLCLDGLDAVAGDSEWEHALFDLFNRMRDRGGCLLFGNHSPPNNTGILLPDLTSRLNWGLTFVLSSYDDEQKVALLQFRAAQRGLEISDGTCRYLLNHTSRNMTSLMAALDRLDKDSLREQRKLTIPFVKHVLNLTG